MFDLQRSHLERNTLHKLYIMTNLFIKTNGEILLEMHEIVQELLRVKLELHGTDIDTDTDFRYALIL